MKSLKVSLLVTAWGTLVYLSGLARSIWPRHPLFLVFLLSLAAAIVFMALWPNPKPSKKPAPGSPAPKP